ncbi:MAG: hypothetical protein ACXWT0_03820 [Methylobacter sp.]
MEFIEDLKKTAEELNLGTVVAKLKNGAWVIYMHPNETDHIGSLTKVTAMIAAEEAK